MLEEIYWHQRARVHWLMAGDKNTKFFHARATCRQKCNRVDRLMNAHGDLCSDDRGKQYFRDLFLTSNPSLSDMDNVLMPVEPRVTSEINTLLAAPHWNDTLITLIPKVSARCWLSNSVRLACAMYKIVACAIIVFVRLWTVSLTNNKVLLSWTSHFGQCSYWV